MELQVPAIRAEQSIRRTHFRLTDAFGAPKPGPARFQNVVPLANQFASAGAQGAAASGSDRKGGNATGFIKGEIVPQVNPAAWEVSFDPHCDVRRALRRY